VYELFYKLESTRAFADTSEKHFPGWMRRIDPDCFVINPNPIGSGVRDFLSTARKFEDVDLNFRDFLAVHFLPFDFDYPHFSNLLQATMTSHSCNGNQAR
jgi:hypothetical protein